MNFTKSSGVDYLCFHDRDLAPEGDTLRESNANLDKVVDKIVEYQKATGMKVLWNTSNLFTNPRFLSGAGTAPSSKFIAYACCPVEAQSGSWEAGWLLRTTSSGVVVKVTNPFGTPK